MNFNGWAFAAISQGDVVFYFLFKIFLFDSLISVVLIIRLEHLFS